MLCVIDEYTRECLAIRVERKLNSRDVLDTLGELFVHYGPWFSGRRSGRVTTSEIDLVRLDTRLDFSVRVTLVLKNGEKVRLPFEATPPHAEFERELDPRGLKTRRTHFQLFQ